MEASTRVVVPGLSDILCGEFRPGHFEGVTTVVAKLFNLVQPDVAVFGEKDYQQLLVIKRMVKDLCFPVSIIGVETVRESSGLAMSSRNQYLSQAELEAASIIYETLVSIARQLKEHLQQPGFSTDEVKALEDNAVQRLRDAGFNPDYVRICEAATLAPLVSPSPDNSNKLRVLAAAWLGKARLIDNVPVE